MGTLPPIPDVFLTQLLSAGSISVGNQDYFLKDKCSVFYSDRFSSEVFIYADIC